MSPNKAISEPIILEFQSNSTHQPMPDILRLDRLRTLREQAGFTQENAARLCGLQGKQSRLTFSQWESGLIIPRAQRRGKFLAYLWDHLGLRQNPTQFEAVWEILVEEWAWEPISDSEWRTFTRQPRPPTAPTNTKVVIPIPPPFQTPALTPHFVGRAAAITQVTDLLTTQDKPPLVALVGMGGVGKTTLAVHVAHALRAHFVDGVLWAQTQVSSPLDILNSWARAFGYDYSSLRDVESCAAALRSALAEKQLLVLLDNVESAQTVRPLFLGGRRMAFLLTTRSEDVAAALGSHVLHLSELAPSEGVQLLTNLLGAARVDSELADATTICQLVHHLPLAVEIIGQLLAARSRRPLAQMAQRLQDVQYRLDLQISDRDVRTSFLVSWEALDDAHRRVFCHLALFAGRTFTADALAAVLGDAPDEVVEQLDTLVARSLVSAVENDRYRQHPLLADFAREQLGDEVGPWKSFATSQLAFARHHQADYARLEPEWDNLMAGMETAHRLQQWQLVLDYADTLTEPWLARARYTQARQGYAWAVEAARQVADEEALARVCQKWGEVCLEQDEYAQAGLLLQESLAYYHHLEEETGIAEVNYWLGRMAVERADYVNAKEHLTLCAQIQEQAGQSRQLARTRYQQASLAFDLEKMAEAKRLCMQAAAYQEGQAKWHDFLPTLRLLADIAMREGSYDIAAAYCERALMLARDLGNWGEFAATHYSLASITRFQGKYEAALLFADQALTLFERMGVRGFQAVTLYEKSRTSTLLKNYRAAQEFGERSVTLFRALAEESKLVYGLLHLGDICEADGRPNAATPYWQEAYRLALRLDHPLREKLQARLQP